MQEPTQVFELLGKIMLLLNEASTSSEKQAVLQVAEKFGGDPYLASYDERSRGDDLSGPHQGQRGGARR